MLFEENHKRRKRFSQVALAASLISAAPLLTAITGCGSDASGGANSSEIGDTAPSTEFTAKGGNNLPGTFGRVGDERNREAAEMALRKNLEARAAGHWRKQCATLSAQMISQIESDAPNFGSGKGCVSGLSAEAQPIAGTKAIRANTLIGPVAVLRIKKQRAYALYHGPKHRDYAMPMQQEAEEWKVARVTTINVP